MTPNEYQAQALRTEYTPNIVDGDQQLSRIMHAMIGVCTEVGELQDAIKKKIIYGKPIDITNVAEEFQDVLWYVAVGLDACGMPLETAMGKNIAKLRARYPDRFTSDRALTRDLDAERAALESADGHGHMCLLDTEADRIKAMLRCAADLCESRIRALITYGASTAAFATDRDLIAAWRKAANGHEVGIDGIEGNPRG